MTVADPGDAAPIRSAARDAAPPGWRVFGYAIGVALAAAALAAGLRLSGFVDPVSAGYEERSTFFLFAAQDLTVALAFAALLALSAAFAERLPAIALPRASRASLAAIVAVGFLGALAMRYVAFHDFDLTLDESAPMYQAQLFLSGRLVGEMPAELRQMPIQFLPMLVDLDPASGSIYSVYRPVHAAMLAAFEAVADSGLLNPALTVVALLAMARIARQVFPDRPDAPVRATLLLLLSAQFLVTAGSGFSFQAHLAFNLLWLTLFLNGTLRSHAAAASIGFLAVGLHQVHVHPLFVFPFLAAVLVGRIGRWWHLFPYAVGYGVALPLWILWPEVAIWLQTGDAAALPGSVSEIAYVRSYLEFAGNTAELGNRDGNFSLLAVNLLRFAMWLSPALLLLSVAGLLSPRGLGRIPLLCAAGVLLTIAVHHVLMPNQSHSWGARYYHAVLGNLVIFALAVWYRLERSEGGATLARATGFLLVAGALFLPWRAIQAEQKVGPRAEVAAAISALDTDYAIIVPARAWHEYHFVRNRPDFGNRPLVGNAADISALAGRDLTVTVLDQKRLEALGLPAGTLYEPLRGPER